MLDSGFSLIFDFRFYYDFVFICLVGFCILVFSPISEFGFSPISDFGFNLNSDSDF